MAGQNPGFTPLGYAGTETDAPRTAQAYQDERSRYLDTANKPMGVREGVELAAGPATVDVVLTHDLGRVPSFAVACVEAPGVVFGSLVVTIEERGERTLTVRVESNLGAVTEVDVVAIILP